MSDIQIDNFDRVRLITINRPAKMNSLDYEANDALVEAFREFDADDDVRVAVITGAGQSAFCAGADLKTYTMAFAGRPAPEFRQRFTNGPGLGGITRNMDVYKPMIAAVNGFAISGGFEIALACDLRFCSSNAEFALQDAKWGFHACDGGLIRLPQIIGLGHAMEMILSGDRVDADHAYRIGLVNKVLAPEALLDHSLEYAQKLARRSPLSHRFAKEVIKRSIGMPMDEALRLESSSFRDLGESEDLAEGTTSFRERRDADFKGC